MLTLKLEQSVIMELEDQAPGLIADLKKNIAIEPLEFAKATEEEFKAAEKARTLIEDVFLTSDSDAPFWACAIEGLDEKNVWNSFCIKKRK